MGVVVKDFRDLALKHRGARFCVMGGADCLLDDLLKVEADIYISANGHGPGLQEPDYVLAMDEIHRATGRSKGEHLRTLTTAPIISPFSYADYRLGDWPQHPRPVLSGMISIWAAWMMGASVVIVAGCDGYGAQNGYLDEAQKIDRDVRCPVRVVSGPLSQVWPLYDPAERFGVYRPHAAIDGWLGRDGRVVLQVLKPCTIAGQDLQKGERVDVYRHEVARLLRHRMVREV